MPDTPPSSIPPADASSEVKTPRKKTTFSSSPSDATESDTVASAKPDVDTPHRRKKENTALDLSEKRQRADRFEANCEAIEGLLAMIPVEELFEIFFPFLKTEPRPEDWRIEFASDQSTKHAEDGEKNFCDKIRESGLLQASFIKDMHKVYGKSSAAKDGDLLSPDIVLLDEDLSMDAGDIERLYDVFTRMLAFGDIKGSDAEDPCKRLGQQSAILTDANSSRKTRGQLIDYGKAFFANSNRTAGYGFVVMPTFARLMRCDRSDVLFSEKFDWKTTDYLSDFFWALDRARAAERGIDTSVTRILSSTPEAINAKAILKEKQASLPHGISPKTFYPENAPIFLFLVYDDESHEYHRVVTSRPFVMPSSSFIGRATRGYLGVDLDEKCPVFMKDAWRINLEGIPKESDTYRRLAARGVDPQYLPGFYCGGDVPVECPPPDCDNLKEWAQRNPVSKVQETATDRYIDEKGIVRPRSDKARKGAAYIEVYPHVHHRQLFKKIGVPLRRFRSTKELCRALYHTLLCHSDALDKAKVLHRDLSGENILIDKDGNGFVSDWDLCRYIDEPMDPRRKGRTGTWEFMSVPLAMGWKDYVQSRRDDNESVVHILFYHILRYTELSGWDKIDLLNKMREVYQGSVEDVTGRPVAGEGKRAVMVGFSFANSQLRKFVKPVTLSNLMVSLRKPFIQVYNTEMDSEADDDDEYAKEHAEQKERDRATLVKSLTDSSEMLIKHFKKQLEHPEWRDEGEDGAKDNFPLSLRSMHPINSYLPKRKSTSESLSYEPGSGRNTARRLQANDDAASSSRRRQESIVEEDAEGDLEGSEGLLEA